MSWVIYCACSIIQQDCLVEEAKDLASRLPAPSLLVHHDSDGSTDHDVSELAGGEEVGDPVLDLGGLEVKAGGDDAALVEAAVELHHNLARAVVVHDLELADVACSSRVLESGSASSDTGNAAMVSVPRTSPNVRTNPSRTKLVVASEKIGPNHRVKP